MLQQTNEGIIIPIKVITKASRSEIVGWENEELKIRLAAVPDKGQANEELIRFLAHHLKIGKTQIRVIKGETSRHKKILITTLTQTDLVFRLKIL